MFRDTFRSRAISLIVLPLNEMLAPNPANRLHSQHPPPPASRQSRQRNRPIGRGSILDADPPPQGVKIARRMTWVRSYAQDFEKLDRLRQQVEAGEITLRVAEVYPPERAAEAHRRLEAGGTRGRLVIQF